MNNKVRSLILSFCLLTSQQVLASEAAQENRNVYVTKIYTIDGSAVTKEAFDVRLAAQAAAGPSSKASPAFEERVIVEEEDENYTCWQIIANLCK